MKSISIRESVPTAASAFIPPSTRWHTGNLLAFSHIDGQTDYKQGLVARTVPDGLVFCYPGAAHVSFQLAAPVATCRITNDWFEIQTENGQTIRGVLLDAYHLLIQGNAIVSEASPAITALQQQDQLLIGATEHFRPELTDSDFDATARQRLQWAESKLPLNAQLPSHSGFTFMRALSQMKGQLCSPEGYISHPWTTPDRWPHRNMWLWDSAFHAIGWRHLDTALAQQMLDAVFSIQAADGFIAHQVSPYRRSVITQPPVLALGVQLVFEKSNDTHWLASVYPKLCAYVEWNAVNRDTDGGGLLEWYIEGDPDCRSGESGMDNSSRFDDAVRLDAPDFNAYQAGEYEILAEFATLLGKPEDAQKWQARYQTLCALMNEKLWSEKRGLYCDRDPATGEFTGIMASAGFLPLYCGAPCAQMAERLVQHLKNPQTFGKAFPIPSIAVPETLPAGMASPYAKDMWRGPTWININWLVARGLRRYGFTAEADQLRSQTLAELEKTCERWGTFFEYFDDRGEVEPPYLLRKRLNTPGKHPHQAIHDYGWSATLYVEWLLNRG